MQIKIGFSPYDSKAIDLKLSYIKQVQGFIYHNLSPHYAEFLHSSGYPYEKRVFKMFSFSRLLGPYRIVRRNGTIIFNNNVDLYFSTPDNKIIEDLASNLMKGDKFKLGSNNVKLNSITVLKNPKIEKKNIIKMLSPITVYSTLLTPDNRKKVYYYSPFEKEFPQMISENLRKKYTAFTGKDPGKMSISLVPKRVSKRNEHIVRYGDYTIKAWDGIYEMSGSKTLMMLAYSA